MRGPARCGAAIGGLVGVAVGLAAAALNAFWLDDLLLGLILLGLLPAAAGALIASTLRRPQSCRFAPTALLVGAAALMALRLVAALRPAPNSGVRLLVVGLDGAAPHLVQEMARRGELPTLAHLMARGSWGPLQSLQPTASPRIWPSILSGTRPSTHGILDWYTRQAALRVPRLWDALEARGWSVGLYRMIVTWPPQPLRGFVIPGWLAPSGETWPARHEWLGVLHSGVRPRQAARRLLDYPRYGLMALREGVTLSEFHSIALWLLERRLFPLAADPERLRTGWFWSRLDPELFLTLVRDHEPELAVYYTDLIDKISHRFWHGENGRDLLDPGSEIVRRAYREVDRGLDRILRGATDARTVICVVSDHGFRADPTAGAPKSLSGTLLIRALDLDPRIHALHPFEGVELYVADAQGAADQLLRRTAERLAALRCIETNGPAFSVRLIDRPGYGDDLLTLELDPVVANHGFPRTELQIHLPAGGRLRIDDLMVAQRRSPGTHDPSGVLILAGPGVRRGRRLEGATVLDVLPTLLALIGEPLWPQIEGRVLEPAINPKFWKAHPPRVGRADGFPLKLAPGSPAKVDDRRLLKELRSLGYLR